MDQDTETRAEIVNLPPSPRQIRETPFPGGECAVIAVGLILWSLLMQGDIARIWTKIKAKRETDKQVYAADISALKDQVASDALNDEDRAAIEEMKKEAGE